MNGKVSDGLTLSNYTTWVFIIGFNHNAEIEGNGIAFQGFKATNKGTDVCLVDGGYHQQHTSGTWLNMNNSNTNSGGWKVCQMRKNIMPLIKSAFPLDLQSVIKSSEIFTADTDISMYSTQDEVFLLAEYEIFGSITNASIQEQKHLKQYAYYSAGNSKVKYKHNDTSAATQWWERSPTSNYSSAFCNVSTGGNAVWNSASYSWGVVPCFKI